MVEVDHHFALRSHYHFFFRIIIANFLDYQDFFTTLSAGSRHLLCGDETVVEGNFGGSKEKMLGLLI